MGVRGLEGLYGVVDAASVTVSTVLLLLLHELQGHEHTHDDAAAAVLLLLLLLQRCCLRRPLVDDDDAFLALAFVVLRVDALVLFVILVRDALLVLFVELCVDDVATFLAVLVLVLFDADAAPLIAVPGSGLCVDNSISVFVRLMYS